MSGIDKQKDWLELVKKAVETGSDSPIYTARNKLEGNIYRPGKQVYLGGQIPPIDHRTIGANEVVIELDAKSFRLNAEYAKKIVGYLCDMGIPYYPFWSGNKSIHIHIFLDLELKNKDAIEYVSKAFKDGMDIWKSIRLAFVREVLEGAGLPDTLIGNGKVVDLQKLSWDMNGRGTLIRACGGANKKVDKLGNIHTAHKTFLSTIELRPPFTRNKPQPFDDVEYPKSIDLYPVEESFILEVVGEWNELAKKIDLHKEFTYTGEHMNTPCIRTLFEGVEAGKRARAAQQIAVAAKLDGLTEAKAMKVIEEYAANCPQVPDPFTKEEAQQWVKWVFKLPAPFWACGICVSLGVCEKHCCDLFNEKHKDDVSFFKEEPLKKYERYLDKVIVGERMLKMQLVLLYTTRFLDPEWSLMIDGPASSGKSHIMKEVAKTLGEEDEDYFIYSRFTGAALDRAGELAKKWENAVVIIEELQGAKNVMESLRLAISEGKLVTVETVEVKNPDGTKGFEIRTISIKLKNTLFVTCQAENEDEGDQFKSRAWILNTDTSVEQTAAIQRKTIQDFGKFAKDIEYIEELKEIQSANKALLIPDGVLFLDEEKLQEKLPANNVRGRRDVKKFVAFISGSAILHQYNRQWVSKDGKNMLVADWRDVAVALEYGWDTLVATSQGLGEKDLKQYQVINACSTTSRTPLFIIEDVMRWCKIGSGPARKLVANLIKEEYLENTTSPPSKGLYQLTTVKPIFKEFKIDDLLLLDQEKLAKDFIETIKNPYCSYCSILFWGVRTVDSAVLEAISGEFSIVPESQKKRGGVSCCFIKE